MSTGKSEVGTLDPKGDVVAVQQVDDVSTLSELTKAEVDVQVATARKYPRSIEKAQDEMHALATLDQDTADSMFYGFRRGGKWIEGPSARFAEIVAYAWGNLRVEGRVVDVGRKMLTAQGIAWDLERNVGARIEVKRKILKSGGERYSDDMITVTGNAAVSIAIRNAVFDVVPAALAKKAYEAAKRVATEEGTSMEKLRRDWVAHFTTKGVDEEDVYRILAVEGKADIKPKHIRQLKGLKNAIEEGDTTLKEAFAKPTDQSASAKDLEDELRGDS